MGGEGRPVKGEKGGVAKPRGERGVAAKRGGKGKRGGHLGFCGRKKRCLR
jgi:hypothetical protein